MRTIRSIAALAVAAGLVTGCSGHSTSGGSDALPNANKAAVHRASSSGTATVTFSITIPAPRKGQNGKRSRYVSPNTQSMTVSVNGGTPQPIGLTVATDPKCTGQNAPIVCTGLSVAAPVGSDTFAFNLYEEPLSGGSEPANPTLLSTYTTPVPIDVLEGVNNSLGTFTLDGVPASIALSPSPLVAPADGAMHAFSLAVTVKDASGATIIPPGNYTAPVNFTVAGDPNGAVSVSPQQLAAPGSGVTVTYDASKALTSATIAAAASGATSGTAFVNPLVYTPAAPPTLVVDGSTTTVAVSEAQYGGVYTLSGGSPTVIAACSHATCKPSTPGGTVSIVISGRKPGSTVLYVSDANGVKASIPLNVIAQPAFEYTGAPQTFVVPKGVSAITVDAFGAAGGHSDFFGLGGRGGETKATVAVTGGETLTVMVGGEGNAPRGCIGGTGGFNGGAKGGSRGERPSPIFCPSFNSGGGGGGASDVRQGGNAASDRIVVAGGGGGSGSVHRSGGDGGGLIGAPGENDLTCTGGGGGTQSKGGAAGRCVLHCWSDGHAGSLGNGGAGGSGTGPLIPGAGGGGGGGGYYGGGGACGTTLVNAGAGGGGSSFAKAGATNVQLKRGVQKGNGLVTFIW